MFKLSYKCFFVLYLSLICIKCKLAFNNINQLLNKIIKNKTTSKRICFLKKINFSYFIK